MKIALQVTEIASFEEKRPYLLNHSIQLARAVGYNILLQVPFHHITE